MNDLDVLTIGDALIDIFLLLKPDGEDFRIDKKEDEICLRLGAKIPVDHSAMSLGGDAVNVAVGIKRLGLRAGIMAETGDDDLSEKIVKELTSERVNIDSLKETKDTPSAFSVVVSAGQDRTIFSHHVLREHDFSFDNLSTEWIYLTSMGEKWREAYRKTIDFVKKNHVKLGFSPGSHQLHHDSESFRDVLAITDILFVNREEGERIAYGRSFDADEKRESVEKLLKDLRRLGPKIVSVTDGPKGSYSMDAQEKVYTEGILETRVVEKTGVGDAYAAGFLAGIIHGKKIETVMKWGATNSASVMEHIGAVKGLLTNGQMAQRLKKE